METSPDSVSNGSNVREALVFLMHQVVATMFIMFSGMPAVLTATFLPALVGVGLHQSSIDLVTSPPYFAAYILWALFLGWSLGAFLQHRAMLWVWVLPAVLLGYMYLRFPHCPAEFLPAACVESRSAYDLYFGRPCTPGAPCLYQLWFTFPFFAAAAYSLGAWVAGRMNGMRDYAEMMTQIRVGRASLVGAAYVGLQLVAGWRQAPHLFASLVGQVGVFLLLEIALFFGVPTYILMVAISLAGRRFALTRCFLNETLPMVAAEPDG